jgi:hypothetical protein
MTLAPSIKSTFAAIGAAIIGATVAFAGQASALTSSITINSVGKTAQLEGTGYAALVPVTVTCATETTIDLTVEVRQQTGRDILGPTYVNSYGYESVPCGPTPTTYYVRTTTGGPDHKPGKATVRVYAQECDPNTFECVYSNEIEQSIRLVR